MSQKITPDIEEQLAVEAEPLLAPGSVVGGRYRIVRHLADGGMARVYVAEQLRLGRNVAIKVLDPQLLEDKDAVKRFFREAVAVSQLRHPNTVTVFDFGETENGHPYIAMELLSGEPLSARLQREGTLTPLTTVAIAQQVASSLEEAHAAGIIHRDLKPENIFIDDVKHDFVKVLDFGIAKVRQSDRALTNLTKSDIMPGTPEYMSPEQCRSHTDFDARSDLYSLAVVMYEMLCGRPPFESQSPVVTLLKHISEPPAPLPAGIPNALARFVISRGLCKDPNGRPSNATAFIEELRAAAANIGASGAHAAIKTDAPPPMRPERRTIESGVGAASVKELMGAGLSQADEDDDDEPTHIDIAPLGMAATKPEMAPVALRAQAFENYAKPAVESLGEAPSNGKVTQALVFAASVWNASVQGPEHLGRVRDWVLAHGSEVMNQVFETLVDRKLYSFGEHRWLVASVDVDDAGLIRVSIRSPSILHH